MLEAESAFEAGLAHGRTSFDVLETSAMVVGPAELAVEQAAKAAAVRGLLLEETIVGRVLNPVTKMLAWSTPAEVAVSEGLASSRRVARSVGAMAAERPAPRSRPWTPSQSLSAESVRALEASRPRPVRPAGTDDIIELYHGTTAEGAASLQAKGIRLNKSRDHLDFGRGFYLTDSAEQAAHWAGPDGAVVKFSIRRDDLAQFAGKSFADGSSPGLWELVRDNRVLGGRQHNYDWVEGPFLGNSVKAIKGAEPNWYGYQLSVHANKLAKLLGKGEIL